MTISEHLAKSLEGNLGLLKTTVGDMSDADLMARPVPAANNANWQIGHVLGAEVMFFSAVGAKMPELPSGFKEMYSRNTAKVDDGSKFLTKAQLLDLWEKVRAGNVALVKTANPEQFAAPRS